jgi:hypothetical protein
MDSVGHYGYTGTGFVGPVGSPGATGTSGATAIMGSATDYAPVTWTGEGFHTRGAAPTFFHTVAPVAAPQPTPSPAELGTLDGAVTVLAVLAVGFAMRRLARAGAAAIGVPGRAIRTRLARTVPHGPAP